VGNSSAPIAPSARLTVCGPPRRQLRLTYDVAGVTFLALGNGAPDVFSSIAAFSSSDPSVVLIGVCELLGASVFITTVVVGAVAILHPASVQPKVRQPVWSLPLLTTPWGAECLWSEMSLYLTYMCPLVCWAGICA
jgi:Ca2+/Na+ antiporter